MSKIQLERLANDLLELNNYIERVKMKNNVDLLSKLKRKRDFLVSKLESVSQEKGLEGNNPSKRMPSYTMINIETGEERDMVLTLAEREELLATGQWEQKLSTAKFVSGVGDVARRQAGSEWNNFLKKTHKNAGRHSKIQT